jgi:toxin ParE1/3/4
MAHRLAPQARAELSNIWAYIVKEGGNVAAAGGVIDAITERFYLLSQYPRLGRVCDDLRPGLRSFAVGQYVIVYAQWKMRTWRFCMCFTATRTSKGSLANKDRNHRDSLPIRRIRFRRRQRGWRLRQHSPRPPVRSCFVAVRRRFAPKFLRANRTTEATLESREECIGADGPSGAPCRAQRREIFRLGAGRDEVGGARGRHGPIRRLGRRDAPARASSDACA